MLVAHALADEICPIGQVDRMHHELPALVRLAQRAVRGGAADRRETQKMTGDPGRVGADVGFRGAEDVGAGDGGDVAGGRDPSIAAARRTSWARDGGDVAGGILSVVGLRGAEDVGGGCLQVERLALAGAGSGERSSPAGGARLGSSGDSRGGVVMGGAS